MKFNENKTSNFFDFKKVFYVFLILVFACFLSSCLSDGYVPGAYSASQSEKDLQLAILQNNNAKVKQLLANGASPDSRSPSSGDYVLTVAVNAGYADIVETLLVSGANPNARNGSEGKPPLFFAMKAPIVKLLIQHGADMYFVNASGTAFHNWIGQAVVLSDKQKEDSRKVLRTQGIPEEMIKQILEPSWLTKQDLVNVVQTYKSLGYDLNKQIGDLKQSVLIVAANAENYDIIEILLSNGANANIKDSSNNTALSYISERNITGKTTASFDKVAKLLVKNGCDVNSVDKDGNTALMFASSAGFSDRVKTLVSLGSNVNLLNSNGEPSLFRSANLNCTKILVEAGAKVGFIAENGNTAIFTLRDADSVSYLISKGVNVNHINNFEQNALTYSMKRLHDENLVFSGDQESLVLPKVNVLIAKKINVNQVSNKKTALAMARDDGFSRIEKTLLQAGGR